MTHTFNGKGKSGKSENDSGDLALRPKFRRGSSSRSKKRGSGLLKRVARATKSLPQSSRYGPRNLRRGAGKYSAQTTLQRVVIKARVVRNIGLRKRGLEKHIGYLQRDGVGKDGKTPVVFDSEQDFTQREAVLAIKEWTEDRHHFRFIISPEKASKLDLKSYAKELVSEMEQDLKTKLEWLSVTHHNTDRPHVHLLIRGRDDIGSDLVMSRDYLARGMRVAAQVVATRELGLRQKKEIEQEQKDELYKVRATKLDYQLKRESEGNDRGLVDVRNLPSKHEHHKQQERQYKIHRLRFLNDLGLAKEVSAGLWRVDSQFIKDLQKRAIEKDIIKTMHQKMRGIEPDTELSVFDRKTENSQAITGKVIHKGLVDELEDQTYIILKDDSGKAHHVSLAGRTKLHGAECEVGDRASVAIKQTSALRRADHTIAEQADKNGGTYDIKLHKEEVLKNQKLPPSVSIDDYFRNYKKRINSLERSGQIERIQEAQWRVPENIIQRLQQSQIKTLEVKNLSRTQDRER